VVRAGSETKIAAGAEAFVGDPLRAESYASRVSPADTFVHLIGVPHPSPAKAREFKAIDLLSIQAAVPAASAAGVLHFIYLSVAQPAPIRKVFQEVRREGEELVRCSGMNAIGGRCR
jgi:uncharacterized protein YbjT (DUF2867 family)